MSDILLSGPAGTVSVEIPSDLPSPAALVAEAALRCGLPAPDEQGVIRVDLPPKAMALAGQDLAFTLKCFLSEARSLG